MVERRSTADGLLVAVSFQVLQPTTSEWGVGKVAAKFLLAHLPPMVRGECARIKARGEVLRTVHRCTTVVGTARLAAIATEDPAVERDRLRCGSFDGVAGDAATGVDHAFPLKDGPRGAVCYAGIA